MDGLKLAEGGIESPGFGVVEVGTLGVMLLWRCHAHSEMILLKCDADCGDSCGDMGEGGKVGGDGGGELLSSCICLNN